MKESNRLRWRVPRTIKHKRRWRQTPEANTILLQKAITGNKRSKMKLWNLTFVKLQSISLGGCVLDMVLRNRSSSLFQATPANEAPNRIGNRQSAEITRIDIKLLEELYEVSPKIERKREIITRSLWAGKSKPPSPSWIILQTQSMSDDRHQYPSEKSGLLIAPLENLFYRETGPWCFVDLQRGRWACWACSIS